jgi:hypothetical protein
MTDFNIVRDVMQFGGSGIRAFTTTTWGQAVFRGVGNVMTQEWSRIGLNLLNPFTKSKPSHQVTIVPRPSRRLSALYKAWSAAVEGRS